MLVSIDQQDRPSLFHIFFECVDRQSEILVQYTVELIRLAGRIEEGRFTFLSLNVFNVRNLWRYGAPHTRCKYHTLFYFFVDSFQICIRPFSLQNSHPTSRSRITNKQETNVGFFCFNSNIHSFTSNRLKSNEKEKKKVDLN